MASSKHAGIGRTRVASRWKTQWVFFWLLFFCFHLNTSRSSRVVSQRDSSVLSTSRVLRWGYITRKQVIYFVCKIIRGKNKGGEVIHTSHGNLANQHARSIVVTLLKAYMRSLPFCWSVMNTLHSYFKTLYMQSQFLVHTYDRFKFRINVFATQDPAHCKS